MSIFKSIAYAYPTSPTAFFLGMESTGCWFVQQRRIDPCYASTPFVAHNCEGYELPDDLDLSLFYLETEGAQCPMFAKYGNAKALRAIELAASLAALGHTLHNKEPNNE